MPAIVVDPTDEGTKHQNGSISLRAITSTGLLPGDAGYHVALVRNCPCNDGLRRVVRATGDSLYEGPQKGAPARITYHLKGKSKSIVGRLILEKEGYRFEAGGNNASLLKPTPITEPLGV